MIKRSLLILIFIICGHSVALKSAQNLSIVDALGSLNNELEQLKTQQILSQLEAMKNSYLIHLSDEIGDSFKSYSDEMVGYIYDNFTSLELDKNRYSRKDFIERFNLNKQSKKTLGAILYPMTIKKKEGDMDPGEFSQNELLRLLR